MTTAFTDNSDSSDVPTRYPSQATAKTSATLSEIDQSLRTLHRKTPVQVKSILRNLQNISLTSDQHYDSSKISRYSSIISSLNERLQNTRCDQNTVSWAVKWCLAETDDPKLKAYEDRFRESTKYGLVSRNSTRQRRRRSRRTRRRTSSGVFGSNQRGLVTGRSMGTDMRTEGEDMRDTDLDITLDYRSDTKYDSQEGDEVGTYEGKEDGSYGRMKGSAGETESRDPVGTRV